MKEMIAKQLAPEDIWKPLSEGKFVRAAVLDQVYRLLGGNIEIGVYRLEDETIATIHDMLNEAKNHPIVFYLIEPKEVEENDCG